MRTPPLSAYLCSTRSIKPPAATIEALTAEANNKACAAFMACMPIRP